MNSYKENKMVCTDDLPITWSENTSFYSKVIYACYINILTFELNTRYKSNYHRASNIRCTLVDMKIADHSDVVGASTVGAAPTTSSFSI